MGSYKEHIPVGIVGVELVCVGTTVVMPVSLTVCSEKIYY